MRMLFPLALILAAQIGAAWALGDMNVARPGASFAAIAAETPGACERLCADDTLCMAWSFQENSCELKAVVPAAVAQAGAISGISERAPAAMRARLEPPPVTTPETLTESEHTELATGDYLPEDEISLTLLGGPEDDAGLRSRSEN
jgi:hypothetical protein